MYEIINEADYGIQSDKPCLIVRQEPSFASGRSLVFRLHNMNDALEILEALNGESDAA